MNGKFIWKYQITKFAVLTKNYKPSLAIRSAMFCFSASVISAGAAFEMATGAAFGVSSVKFQSPPALLTFEAISIGVLGQVSAIAICTRSPFSFAHTYCFLSYSPI